MLSLGGAGIVPLSGNGEPIGRSELRARLHYEPLEDLPTALDADVAAQLWFAGDLDARAGRDSQPPARVRELALSHGHERALFAALGRLRYASRALGMLDGAKVQAAVGPGLLLGAFGGFVPDPIDGSPAADASRFGAEVGWEDLSLASRPRAVLSAHGSRFEGDFDERRLNAFVDMFPGAHRLGAHAELSIHGADNPWNAPAQELSAAGADVGLRFGNVDLGARLDMQRPERSRWLASFVPLQWLCVTQTPDVAGDPEPCYGDETRYLASADAGVRFGQLALHAGTTASTSNRGDTDQLGGFVGATVLRVVDELRIDTSLMASTGSLLRTYAGSLGLGMPFAHGVVDVSLRYRPAWTRYVADTGPFLEHGVGAHLDIAPAGELSFGLDADAITGRDLDVLLLQALLTYRPQGA
jgi:hypothetical protein